MDDLRNRIIAAATVGTGPIADAMEQLRLRRGVLTGWRYISKDPRKTMVGPAFTLRQASKPRGAAHEDNRMRQGDVSSKLAQPGDIILIDVNGRTDVATWGENQSMMAQSRGVAGLVVHGAIRDSEWTRELGFQVLCRGVSPVASRWDLESVAVNEPVVIEAVTINPGDILYGDADGLIVIPQEQAAEILDKAIAIHQGEEKRRADLHGHGR